MSAGTGAVVPAIDLVEYLKSIQLSVDDAKKQARQSAEQEAKAEGKSTVDGQVLFQTAVACSEIYDSTIADLLATRLPITFGYRDRGPRRTPRRGTRGRVTGWRVWRHHRTTRQSPRSHRPSRRRRGRR